MYYYAKYGLKGDCQIKRGGLSAEDLLKTRLIEEYSNEKKPTDGEIYRKIRQYHFQQNLHFEWRWWSRLSSHEKRCLKQLLRHEELTAALDALREIPGLWGGMRLHTWNTISAIKCDDIILHYLYHVKDIWGKLLQHDASAMQYVDEVTVQALELRAPRVSTRDADELRGQVLGRILFSAFSERDRVGIWARLQAVDDLIPSLDALFKNLNYVKALADCMTRLVRLSPGDTVSTALFKAFADTNQRPDRAIIQVTESSFSSSPASSADHADLGVRQLYAYAMRHYLQMPRDLKGKELLARHATNADRTVLHEFADLAERLGFESPEITALKEYPRARDARNPSENSKPLLVTDGVGVIKKRRCGLPSMEEYVEDSKSLFVNRLHDVDKEPGEGITSFFVRMSIYFASFGKPSPLPLEGLHPRNNAIDAEQELERRELERQERDRKEQERRGQERPEQERRELERQDSRNRSSPPCPELPLAETQHHFNEMDRFSSSKPSDLSLFEEDEIIMRDQAVQMLLDHQLDSIITRDQAVQVLLDHQRDSTTLLILEEVSEDSFRFYNKMYDETKEKLPRLEKDLQYLTVEPLTENLHYQNAEGHRKRRKTRQVKVVEPFSVHAQSVVLVARRDSQMARVIYGKM